MSEERRPEEEKITKEEIEEVFSAINNIQKQLDSITKAIEEITFATKDLHRLHKIQELTVRETNSKLDQHQRLNRKLVKSLATHISINAGSTQKRVTDLQVDICQHTQFIDTLSDTVHNLRHTIEEHFEESNE